MRRLATLLVFAALAAAQDKPGGTPYEAIDPNPDQVKEAVGAINAAFKDKKATDAQLAAIKQYGGYADEKVVRALAKGLRSKNGEVKLEAIDAFGWNQHKESLKQLHRLYRREKQTLHKQEDLYAATFKAIGRHGKKKSLEVLGDSVFKGITSDVAQARIYGIANIRHKDSVVGLLKGMRLTSTQAGGRTSGRVAVESRGMRFFRVGLAVLTGQDFGGVSEDWQRWWRKNKGKFRMSPTRPPDVKQDIKDSWSSFWGTPY